jgi:hypothetical protein
MRKLRELNDLLKRVPLLAHVVLVIGFAITFWQIDQTSGKVDQSTNHILGTLVAVNVNNCNNDLIFRKQYKIRGDAEKRLLDLFLDIGRKQLKTLPPGPQRDTSAAFIREFAPLDAQIHIIPVPDCAATKQRLKAALGDDIEIPVLHTAPSVKSNK